MAIEPEKCPLSRSVHSWPYCILLFGKMKGAAGVLSCDGSFRGRTQLPVDLLYLTDKGNVIQSELWKSSKNLQSCELF